MVRSRPRSTVAGRSTSSDHDQAVRPGHRRLCARRRVRPGSSSRAAARRRACGGLIGGCGGLIGGCGRLGIGACGGLIGGCGGLIGGCGGLIGECGGLVGECGGLIGGCGRLVIGACGGLIDRPAAPGAGLRPARWVAASNRKTEPATEALSEATRPRMGMRAMTSTRRRTRASSPRPSLPTTMASGPRMSTSRTVNGASPSAPTMRTPRVCRSTSPAGRSSRGTSRRCSTAPAEVFTAAGLMGAAPRRGEEHAVHAAGLRRAQQRAHVLGVLEVIEDEHEGRLAARARQGQHLLERGPAPRGHHEGHALVAVEPADGGQAAAARPRRPGCAASWRAGRAGPGQHVARARPAAGEPRDGRRRLPRRGGVRPRSPHRHRASRREWARRGQPQV